MSLRLRGCAGPAQRPACHTDNLPMHSHGLNCPRHPGRPPRAGQRGPLSGRVWGRRGVEAFRVCLEARVLEANVASGRLLLTLRPEPIEQLRDGLAARRPAKKPGSEINPSLTPGGGSLQARRRLARARARRPTAASLRSGAPVGGWYAPVEPCLNCLGHFTLQARCGRALWFASRASESLSTSAPRRRLYPLSLNRRL